MKTLIKKHFLFELSFLKTVFAIAIPIAMQNTISFGVSVMDSVMVGSLGDVAISAANIGTQPFSLLMAFGFGLSSGGSVLIAQYWGKKDMQSIRKVMRMSMQFVMACGLLFTLLGLCLPEQFMRIYSSEEVVVQTAASYLSLVALSYLPYCISNNYMMSLRAVEQVKLSVLIYGISFFVNVLFNYTFIFGKFGAPALGVRGAAVGTILARCSELLMVLYYMYRKEKVVKFRIHECLRWDKSLTKSYTRHSLPVVGNEIVWGIGISITTIVIGQIGSTFLAANSIAGVLNQLAFVSVIGVANAAAVLTGKTIGAGFPERAQRMANTLIVMSFGMGMFNCCLLLVIRPIFLQFYNISAETYDIAWQLIFVMALVQMALGVDVTCIVGILRGGGDTTSSFLIDCGALWLFSVPMGILAGLVLHWPVPLVFVCLKLDSPIKAICSIIRVRSGKWIRNVTVQNIPSHDENP